MSVDPPSSRASIDGHHSRPPSSTRWHQGDSDEDDQPMLFYHGSPMHDYLASVAPEEVHTIRPMDSLVQRPGSGHSQESPEAVEGMTGRPSISPRRESRSSSKTIPSTSAIIQPRRKRSSPSKHTSIPRTSSTSPSKRQLTTPSPPPPPRLAAEQPEEPLLHEARERLNLLLVSYLSAPHYSALPLQDQECIDRETVNAFLLDERFQRYGRQSTVVGGRNHHGDLVSTSLRNTGSRSATSKCEEQQDPNQLRPTPVVISKSQLIILGLCSLALFTPTFSSSNSTSSSTTSQSILNELVASFLPETINSWPAWTSALIRTAPGVVALTSLATLFARSSLRSSSSFLITPATDANARQVQDENERDAIVQELKGLFATCKKFIDECTRLDITLEKGFTVISELDGLAGLDSEQYEYTEESDIRFSGENERDDDDGHWQDLTTIEARLSTRHPAQYQPSKQETHRRRRRNKRLPALEVRSAIFSSLYTIQEKLEKDLDTLSTSLAGTSSALAGDLQAGGTEEKLDGLELVRLFDMYNCHPPTYQNQYTAAQFENSSVQEDEQAAEELYRRTMARRSLSPTLYNEQQQQAQSNNPAVKLKHRRSGIYIPDPSTTREEFSTTTHSFSNLSHEEQLSRRASWAAFQPSQRRNVQSALHQQQQKAAPASPSSTIGSRPRNTAAIATPPRVRPQSIHFGGVLPAPSDMMKNVTSSPLANGARESNSTIKRERRRRSDQLFSTSALQSNLQLPHEETLSQLRSSTSSTASRSSSVDSSTAMRMSTSSQGTSADPITAASCIPEMYDSPSRPGHTRRTSLGPVSTSSSTLLKQQNRRSRPLSMHEIDHARSLQRNSFAHLNTMEKTPLDGVPEADSTALHRNAAAAALERKWSSHAQNHLSNSISASSSLTSSVHSRARSRPTSLLLQSSPILSSPQVRRETGEADSPAASFRSRKSQHRNQRNYKQDQQTRSKFDLISLRESSQNVSTLERALVCHLLALKYSSLSTSKLQAVLRVLVEVVDGINSTINTETTSLSQTMWEEFEDTPNEPDAAEMGSTAPAASVLLATPMTSSPFQSTPQRHSFIACLPGSYPSSPIIEVDPATPPSDVAKQVSDGSFFPNFEQNEVQPNFAPREPFSSAEQSGRNALGETHFQLNAALRTIATKLYMERQDLKEYFNDPQNSDGDDPSRQNTLDQMEARHESLRTDLQTLMKSWEEGRATFRQMKEGRQRRLEGPRASRTKDRQTSSDTSEYDNAEEEPSLLSTSAELEKYGSISSVLSSGNEDSLSTPALSPISQATYQPMNIADLLLDSNNTQYLPRFGMQEQLFEACVDNEESDNTVEKGKGKLSREERIALAKAKRLENKEQSAVVSKPQANAELISELKDMVALLRSRNAAVLPQQQT